MVQVVGISAQAALLIQAWRTRLNSDTRWVHRAPMERRWITVHTGFLAAWLDLQLVDVEMPWCTQDGHSLEEPTQSKHIDIWQHLNEAFSVRCTAMPMFYYITG